MGRFFDTDYPGNVFDGKKYGNDPFQGEQDLVVARIEILDAFQHDQDYTGNNHHKEQQIEPFPHWGVCLIDDFVKLASPGMGAAFFQAGLRVQGPSSPISVSGNWQAVPARHAGPA